MEPFWAWQAAITSDMLCHMPLVELLRQASGGMTAWFAEYEVNQSILRWQLWVSEGPAKGLRRQHRMSRVANGWIPSGVTDQEQTYEGEHEHFLGEDGARLTDLQSSVVHTTT